VLGGSSAESDEQKGAAHFLAAAAYSGNHKNSGLRVVRYLESLGAVVKSIADREKVYYRNKY
jgi:predicted Zn-dependent peptidase